MKRTSLLTAAGGAMAGAGLVVLALGAPSHAFNGASHTALAVAPAVGQLASQGVRWGEVANLADLVERVSPSVVQIIVRGSAPERNVAGRGGVNPFEGTPFEEFFNRSFPNSPSTPGGDPPPGRMGSGSGFFIEGGYVVTNNHVIEQARRVTLVLHDGREVEASVVGTDEKTDIAVLKVEGRNLPGALVWGDSSNKTARPGDSVFAVGSPFGLGNTVTAGIISARGRFIGGTYDDYIQVDAPINRGNSGGPLFNTAGQVIGVNSAIYSPTGGNVGIGFSIPSELAKSIVRQIIETGGVERGWLGVEIQNVTPDIARGLGLDAPKGAMVVNVTDGSPAARAGLKTGDVIQTFGGRSIDSVPDLTRAVAETKAGTARDVRILRGGKQQTLNVRIAALEPTATTPTELASASPGASARGGALNIASIGVDLSSDGASGVVVSRVQANSAAADAGLRTGDRIVKANQADVTSPESVRKAVDDAKKQKREAVLLQIERGGRTTFIGVPLNGG